MKNKLDASTREAPVEKIKLDDESFGKVMTMALNSINKERVFKFSNYRINSILLNDKFTVELNVVVPDSLDDGGMQLAKCIINRAGIIERVISLQSLKELKGRHYKESTEALKTILKDVKV